VNTIRRTLVLAAAVVAAACTADGAGRQLVAPEGHPHFTITSSTVTCPDTISVGQSAQCTAYFYDENHNLVSTTPTWGTNTPTLVSVSSTGVVTGLAIGLADVHATAGSVTGSKSVYVKAGLTVGIFGPSQVQKFDTCEWSTSVSGGTPPYSYSWSVSSASGTSFGDYWEGYLIGGQSTMSVTVTDANGVQKTATRSIVAFFNAPLC
jgi:hypothetical protein